MKYWLYSAMAALTVTLAWLGWKQHQLAGELARIKGGREVLLSATGKQDTSIAAIQELRNRFERTRIDLSAALHGISQTSSKVDGLQKAVDNLNRQMHTTLAMLETNVASKPQPPPAPTSPEKSLVLLTEPAQPPPKPKPRRKLVQRPWSPEQAVGAPDTMQAGDNPTAWAPLSPNSGMQWLELEYEKPVEVAEIRVRQTFNPGAICKITVPDASGQETKLWEGKEPPTQAPVEMSFPAGCRVRTDKVKVYLDTRRVAGWNEIDAVELIGRDGTRQWAMDAKASSSYADR
jgi:hypothetical protein